MAKLTFLGCDQDAYCASVARHIRSFEESSGHQVQVRILDNDEYFSNRLGPYLEGETPADVYMSDRSWSGSTTARATSSPWIRFLPGRPPATIQRISSRRCFDATGGAVSSASRSELDRCSKCR
jgi:hypothetical protein